MPDRTVRGGFAESLCGSPQVCVAAGKIPEAGALAATEKKVKVLEQQRTEVGS